MPNGEGTLMKVMGASGPTIVFHLCHEVVSDRERDGHAACVLIEALIFRLQAGNFHWPNIWSYSTHSACDMYIGYPRQGNSLRVSRGSDVYSSLLLRYSRAVPMVAGIAS